MTIRLGRSLLVALSLTFALPALMPVTATAQQINGPPPRSARAQETGRILVKWRDGARSLSTSARSQKASAVAGLKLQASGGNRDIEALKPEGAASPADLAEAVAQLERDADVEAASIEYRRKLHKLTNDPLLMQQWYLLSTEVAATRAEAAWDVTEGNAGIIVAVVDTGVRFEHPDLQGKVLPGYDFIADPVVANDGNNARDSDASDPGDWVTTNEVNQSPNDFLDEDCLSDAGGSVNSSWHGTRVAGLIAAATDNNAGVAGNAWQTIVLPIRAMGKCGGFDFDIITGMRWAAGLTVPGIPNNTNPAKVINLSLGGEGPCTTLYQNAVNEIIATGTVIVASAGNEGRAVSAPANCNGVLGVGGLRHAGTKVGYSSLGPQVGISAPAGNCVDPAPMPCVYSIIVATNTGTTVPLASDYTNPSNANFGTSFSAPLVASAAALLHAVNGSLTPAQTILLLKDAARPFPAASGIAACTVPTASSAPQLAECNCTAQTCGAGMLDTGAALLAVQGPLAVLETNGTVGVGSTVSISGSSSFAGQGRTITAHQWSIVNATGATPTIANTGSASTTLSIPGEAQFTLRLTVTDDQGTQDSKDVALSAAAAPPPPVTPDPPASPAPPAISKAGGGGGGGQLGWELWALALLGLIRRKGTSATSA